MQVAGWLTATVTALPDAGEPFRAGTLELAPLELREAYRTGFAGTHYTLEVPLEIPAEGGDNSRWAARVVVRDGVTGEVHEADALLAPRAP